MKEKRKSKRERKRRGAGVGVCGVVDRLNEPEKQPKQAPNERTPGEKGGVGVSVWSGANWHVARKLKSALP